MRCVGGWLLGLLGTWAIGTMACQKPRICPAGYKQDVVEEQAVWCRGGAGQAVFYELHPGTRDKRQSCPFVTGIREGEFEAWHPNGRRWLVGRYVQGKLEGKWEQWSETGSKAAEGEYREGRLVRGAPVAMAAICDRVEPR